MKTLTWKHEEAAWAEGWKCVAGVDEAGRGCLAGPVVAAALFFLDKEACPIAINDSKKLSADQRREFFEQLTSDSRVVYAVGIATVEEIDRLNILKASLLAMKRAVEGLNPFPDYVIVDGRSTPRISIDHQTLVGGDRLSPSVAAAAVVAKETRDRIMERLDTEFPGYGFAQHKGYGTVQHLAAIQKCGVCLLHRRSFEPVRQILLPLG